MPTFELPPATPQEIKQNTTGKKEKNSKRKDLPKRRSANNLAKPCRKSAVKLAKAKGALADIVARVEEDFAQSPQERPETPRGKTVKSYMLVAKVFP